MKFQFRLIQFVFIAFLILFSSSVAYSDYNSRRFNNTLQIYLSDIDPKEINQITSIGSEIYNKQFESAQEPLENLLKKYPDLPLLHKFYAQILHDKNKKQEALDYLTTQIQVHANRLEFINIRAQFLFEKKYYESAKEDFYTLIEAGIQEASIYENLAKISMQQIDYQSALDHFNQALKLDPDNDKIWFTKSTLEYALKQYRQAKLSCEQALRINPAKKENHYFYLEILSRFKNKQDLKNHLLKADNLFPLDLTISDKLINDIYFPEKKYEQAQEILKKLIRKYPKNPQIYFQLGVLFYVTDNQKSAIAAYHKTLELNPKHPNAEINLAQSYLILNDIVLAEKALARAVKKNTRDLFAYEKLTQIYLSYKDTIAAEEIILKGLKINPRSVYLIYEYANILKRRGKYKNAIVAFEQALKLQKNNIEIIGNLGELYRLTKETEKSEQKFKEALNLNSKVDWIHLFYSDLLSQQKRYGEALNQLSIVLERTSTNFYAHLKKAYIYYRLKDYSKALEIIDTAIELNPKSLNQYVVKGDILMKLGEFEESVEIFSQVVEASSGSASALTNLAQAQLFIAPATALENVNLSIAKANFDIQTLELKLYLSGEYKKIWNFDKDNTSHEIYEDILHLRTGEASQKLNQLPKHHLFYRPLRYLLELIQDEEPITLSEDNHNMHPWYAFYIGNEALDKRNYTKANQYFQTALQLLPNNQWVLVKQSLALQGIKHYQLAVDNLLFYLSSNPDSYWAKIRLAINYDYKKDAVKAEKTYLELLKINSEDAWVLNNLAWLYLTTDNPEIVDPEGALKLALKAVKLNANSENLDTLAEAYFQKKDYKKALKAIVQALDIDRSDQDHFKKQKKKILKMMNKE
jgi:tetratricopeptide (TPR) repeat protein